ncbi:hypothetical protein QUB80_01360 [Chlorogloeopsis sp. ULAP01]|nr:hypothetical protein [Chlorogloeopsis sp. ULAP01]MDM9379356.1 hypothetical protein [Chlorogloeopsis sp. ULAP01]
MAESSAPLRVKRVECDCPEADGRRERIDTNPKTIHERSLSCRVFCRLRA